MPTQLQAVVSRFEGYLAGAYPWASEGLGGGARCCASVPHVAVDAHVGEFAGLLSLLEAARHSLEHPGHADPRVFSLHVCYLGKLCCRPVSLTSFSAFGASAARSGRGGLGILSEKWVLLLRQAHHGRLHVQQGRPHSLGAVL